MKELKEREILPQQRNRVIDSLEVGDRVLIEFKGGMVLDDGSSIAILEGTVITTSGGLKQVSLGFQVAFDCVDTARLMD